MVTIAISPRIVNSPCVMKPFFQRDVDEDEFHHPARLGALRKICNPRKEALLRRMWGRRQEANFTSCAPLEPSSRRIEFGV